MARRFAIIEQSNTFCHLYQIIWEFRQAMTDSLVISVSSQMPPSASDAFHAQNGHVERGMFSGYAAYIKNEVKMSQNQAIFALNRRAGLQTSARRGSRKPARRFAGSRRKSLLSIRIR